MKTSIFLDTSDLYHQVKRRHSTKLDYDKVLKFFGVDNEIITAIAYGIQSDHEATGFISCLKRAGFIPKFRKPEEINLESRKIRRSTSNVEMAVDIMSRLDRLDCVILGTGNPEFAPLVKHISDKGVRCIVFTCTTNLKPDFICEVPECVLES